MTTGIRVMGCFDLRKTFQVFAIIEPSDNSLAMNNSMLFFFFDFLIHGQQQLEMIQCTEWMLEKCGLCDLA